MPEMPLGLPRCEGLLGLKAQEMAIPMMTAWIGFAMSEEVTRAGEAEMKPTSSGYAHVNGIKLYHEIYGQGEALMLIELT